MLPHLKGRPLTLRRFPEGVGRPDSSFFEKNCPKHRPEWVKTTPIYVDRRAGEIDFCLCENQATLIWMAQLSALELHPLSPRQAGSSSLLFSSSTWIPVPPPGWWSAARSACE